LQDTFDRDYKVAAAPVFTNDCGFPPDKPNTTTLVYSDAWVTSTFKAAGGTLEMTMLDIRSDPRAATGWSPERSRRFGAHVVGPLLRVVPGLRKYRGYGAVGGGRLATEG
jgi:hypothetical protein